MKRALGVVTGASYAFALGSVIYLLAEAIAAAGYPGYSYFTQVISVLGVYPGMLVHGHVSPSKLAVVMNVGFFVTGALFVIGHLGAMHQHLRRRWANAVGLMAVLFAAGISLVGAVQGGQPTAGGWHSLGAALAIFGGNTALVLTGLGLKTPDARWFRIGCVTLGLLGILSALGLLVIFETPYPDLGATAERLSVYTIIAGSTWASVFLVRARARPRPQDPQLLIASSAAA